MKLYPIETGNFKLDGGAMFGVVPRALWERTNPADANNLIELAMRSLLIEEGDRLILIDTGIGNKQSDKFFGHYHLYGDFSLDSQLAKYGFKREDITDVFLTHLHFDHCGGVIKRKGDTEEFIPAFPNAKVWSNRDHWLWATEPNAREKGSFLPENIFPIEDNGQLNFIDGLQTGEFSSTPLGFDVLRVDGHTDAQMLPAMDYKGHKLVFMADLLPTVGHIPLPYVMGYDTRPLLTLDEKAHFLDQAAKEQYLLFLEHDAQNVLCTVKATEKGVRLDQTYTWTEVFGQ